MYTVLEFEIYFTNELKKTGNNFPTIPFINVRRKSAANAKVHALPNSPLSFLFLLFAYFRIAAPARLPLRHGPHKVIVRKDKNPRAVDHGQLVQQLHGVQQRHVEHEGAYVIIKVTLLINHYNKKKLANYF